MYIFYYNNEFYMSSLKTEKVRHASIRIDVAFSSDCSSVDIHNVKRLYGTSSKDLIKTIEHVITYARINNRSGVCKVTCQTPKIADSILRKAGFDTINGQNVYNLIPQF